MLPAVAAAGMSPQVNPKRWPLRRDPDAQPARGDCTALTAAGSKRFAKTLHPDLGD
jgi:hypothetical protein